MVAGNLGSAADEFICYTINLPPIYTKVWIAEIANDFLMLVLILAKGYSTMRKCDDKKNGIVLDYMTLGEIGTYKSCWPPQ